MSKETSNYFKLGIFVLIGATLLIAALYLIGSKRNVFSSTIKVTAVFSNVNGLIPGNNVRYGGIDVGTVDDIVFQSDTGIIVKMIIQNKLKSYIKKNTLATIGTDGLMGNKLVNLIYVDEASATIEDGDKLKSEKPVDTEDMVRTLNMTNQNLLLITNDLKRISGKLNQKNNLFDLLGDKSIGENIKGTFTDFRSTAEKTNMIANNANALVLEMKNGKGLVGSILKDTSSIIKIKTIMKNIESVSDSLKRMSHKLNTFANNLNDNKGTVYTLTKDSVMSNNIKQTISNINKGTVILNEDLKALQSNWFFKSYFKKKEKEEKKAASMKK